VPAITRKLTLLDSMVLVAATAVGMAGAVAIWRSEDMSNFTNNRIFPASLSLIEMKILPYYIYNYSYISSPIAATWTVAVCLLAFRRPRPALHQLIDQPGVAACWAATLTMMISISLSIWEKYRLGYIGHIRQYTLDITTYDALIWSFDESFRPVGLAVCSVWVIAAIGRRWLPEPNWLDRTGRCLGVIWIVSTLLAVAERPL
jgi:hypothetical protein